MAGEPCIISVATTGSVPRKKDKPALPVTTAERMGSTYAAYGAGAALVQVHVRNPDETPSGDPDRFTAFREGVRAEHGRPVATAEQARQMLGLRTPA